MILKSYEIKKYSSNFSKYNFYLSYGENSGLKKDIIDVLKSNIKQKDDNVEIISLYENEIIEKEEDFDNSIFSGSLFGNKKIIIISGASDKTIKKIDNDYEKYPENTFIIICAGILDKKSKLRAFFEKNENTFIIPFYEDNYQTLAYLTQNFFYKNV